MKKYFKDYVELQKATMRFNRQHWFGNIVCGVACCAITIMACSVVNAIIDKSYEEKLNNDISEEEESL